MSLRHGLLAALLEGEASGYELSKRFDVSVANYWTASPQQLYRELERMEGEGLVDGRVVEQQRRPNKRSFSITETGRRELVAFTGRPARPSAIRDELLVKLAAVDVGDRDAVAVAVRERLEQARGKLAVYARLREHMLVGRGEDEFVASGERIGPYLTLLRGISFEQENLVWGDRVLALLAVKRRGPDTAEV
jgi:DNA-binding PadR family transcriptional regulator